MLHNKKIDIGIDATNISSGGGLTHLQCLLNAVNPENQQFNRIILWTNRTAASNFSPKPWLQIKNSAWSNWSLIPRVIAQALCMPYLLRHAGVNVLFAPGGSIPYKVSLPVVSMSQNMLPFEDSRANLFGRFSMMRVKIWLLHLAQVSTFEKVSGLIFLTEYARKIVYQSLRQINFSGITIPHGIEMRFFQTPRSQRSYNQFSFEEPFKILYVSILMPYKHQIEVAYAVSDLRAKGVPVEITFVGYCWGWYGKKFLQILKKLDDKNHFLHFLGLIPFQILHKIYQKYDCFLFASSCENLPNILIEAMAAGLPVLSSSRGPMPEVLGDAGLYFDPEVPSTISEAILRLAKSIELRENLAKSGWLRAQAYSWESCANRTFDFIEQIANQRG